VPVFVDTNVWVYAADGADPVKQARSAALLAMHGADIVVSTQVLGEFYVTLTRKLRADADSVRAAVARMAGTRVVAVDVPQVMRAIELTGQTSIAYWDALIVAAAESSGCERLLTEDLGDGQRIGSVRVENPFVDHHRRMAEPNRSYEPSARTSWTDAELRAAVGRYEDACRSAGMLPNAVHSYWDYAGRFLGWREGTYQPRGMVVVGRPVTLRTVTASDLADEASMYRQAILSAGLSRATVETYHRHAMLFVRWLAGDFAPGGRLQKT
jgi:predicted nucleic acid-binding protein